MCLYVNDRLPNGAGFTRWLRDHFAAVLTSVLGPTPANGFARSLRAPAHADCDSRCPGCLQHYRNMNYHGLFDWRLGLSFLQALADPSHACGLDGRFDTPELLGWLERTRSYRDAFCAAFGFTPRDYGPLLGFEADGAAYVVRHPLWQEQCNRRGNVLAAARAEAGASGLPVRTVDAFNLKVRPAWTRFNLLS